MSTIDPYLKKTFQIWENVLDSRSPKNTKGLPVFLDTQIGKAKAILINKSNRELDNKLVYLCRVVSIDTGTNIADETLELSSNIQKALTFAAEHPQQNLAVYLEIGLEDGLIDFRVGSDILN